jgi:hypothetical protein
MKENMVTYDEVRKEFFRRAEENCSPIQLEKMRENFPNYFSIAIMQYKTIGGVDIYAYESMELMIYYIRTVIYAVRSMRHSTGKSAKQCMDILLEEGRIGYRRHYQRRCYLKAKNQVKLQPELLQVRDTHKGITKTELKVLWLSFYDKVLTNKQRDIVRQDIAKAKEEYKHKEYLLSSTIRVRYSRILRQFTAYLQIDKSKKLGNLSTVEFLLTIDKMMMT